MACIQTGLDTHILSGWHSGMSSPTLLSGRRQMPKRWPTTREIIFLNRIMDAAQALPGSIRRPCAQAHGYWLPTRCSPQRTGHSRYHVVRRIQPTATMLTPPDASIFNHTKFRPAKRKTIKICPCPDADIMEGVGLPVPWTGERFKDRHILVWFGCKLPIITHCVVKQLLGTKRNTCRPTLDCHVR